VTRILTIANQKGGVGKTTTAVNVAAALALAGGRVLLIDLDPQGNASTALGIDHTSGVADVYDTLTNDVPLVDIVQECPDISGLLVAPATVDLAGAEIELVDAENREYRLTHALREYLRHREASDQPVDYVLIDCPPSLGLLTLNGLVAAREVLLPTDLHVSAIVLTMYDGRTRLASQVAYEVRTHFGARVLDTVVPRSVRVSEAPSHGLTVIGYDPSNSGAIAYREVAEQLHAIGEPAPVSTPTKDTYG
jgi:chromosome partitioning protein